MICSYDFEKDGIWMTDERRIDLEREKNKKFKEFNKRMWRRMKKNLALEGEYEEEKIR